MSEKKWNPAISSKTAAGTSATGVSGALVVLLVWATREFTTVELPADVAVALSTIVMTTATFLVGWIMKPTRRGRHAK